MNVTLEITSEVLRQKLKDTFGFTAFRPYQEAVCLASAQAQDLLLVMPTGAGKSLCYQLPGLVRKGTTLVISPLVALMEDQVIKLKEKNLRADRIHANRERLESRQVCFEYLEGKLDFLFIAPERLAIPGFLEMLAKRKPNLIAIDEAHCISQWGHDFRPEYRMLSQRLHLLRPAPVIALTATATPQVQNDIIEQLGLKNVKRFIHGFRRNNIAIEVAELKPSGRTDAIISLVKNKANLPAIVYAPTRNVADELAGQLSTHVSSAAYHAGLNAKSRDAIQAQFIDGRLDVIVATIAFGMGIDKSNIRSVIHAALPGSVESYYQEIGRAGRDGLPSRAILLYSYADRRTHEFFHGRDYPEIVVLESIFNETTSEPKAKDEIRDKLKIDTDVFDKALEKLWLHGGVVSDAEENITKASSKWKPSYLLQRNHKLTQLQQITQFAESNDCRMLRLVKYFGDQNDTNASCGLCDICAQGHSMLRRFISPNEHEQTILRSMIQCLLFDEKIATGKLFREVFGEESSDRRKFERLMGGLSRAGLIELFDDSFEKDGKKIQFRRVSLSLKGRRIDLNKLSEVVTLSEQQSESKKKERKKKSILKKSKAISDSNEAAPNESQEKTFQVLRIWRLAEAKKRQLPAFRILSDRVLWAIAEKNPSSNDDLLSIHGMGPNLTAKFGSQILDVIKNG